jgi:hypothetical protein
MSASSSTTASHSTFRSIFHAASKVYKKKTGQDLRTHPLAVELTNCDSPNTVLKLFQKQADALDDAGKSAQALMRWLNPTVHILYVFSATLGTGIGLVSASEQDFPVSPVSSSMNILFVAVPSSEGHIYGNRRPSRGNFTSDSSSRASCDTISYRLLRTL